MAIYTKVSGATEHPIEMHEHLANTIVSASGMVDETSDFAVTEQTSPALGVKVSTGRAWLVKSDNSISYPVRSDTDVEDTSTAITSNGTGNPRIDAVVLFYDEGAGAPQVDGTEVAKLQVVAGTAAALPTAPDNTAIVSAIGGSYPYTILAEVAVASGATTILDANITDVREKATVEAGASADGWTLFEGTTLTFGSTTDGVDTLDSTDDLTSSVQVGEWVKITSGAGTDLIYKVSDVTASTIDVVGEVSVSGSITAMSFSKARVPQGAQSWSEQFKLRYTRISSQTLNDNTNTVLTFPNMDYDSHGNFTGTNTFTAPVSGIYNIAGMTSMQDSAVKLAWGALFLKKNGTTPIDTNKQWPAAGNTINRVSLVVTSQIELFRGDYIQFSAIADTTDSGTVIVAPSGTDKNSINVQFVSI